MGWKKDTTMTPQELREIWGPIGQIGYVVDDLESAALQWTRSIGIGPWKIFDPAPFDSLQTTGTPTLVEAGKPYASTNGS